MHPVSVAVLLTAVVMAQADQMSDVLHVPPHEQHLYIFDVTSEASEDDLKAALGNFSIEDGFKVIGERRFLFLVSSKDTSNLHSLTFPAGSAVTQHPVENMDQYNMEMLGIREKLENYIGKKSREAVWFFVEYQRNWPETACSKEHKMLTRNYAQKLKKLHDRVRPLLYIDVASAPARWLEFYEMGDSAMGNLVKSGTPITHAGFQEAHIAIKRAVRI